MGTHSVARRAQAGTVTSADLPIRARCSARVISPASARRRGHYALVDTKLNGRSLLMIRAAAIAIVAFALGASCSDSETHPLAGTTSSIVEVKESDPSSTVGSSTVLSSEQRCTQFAPSDQRSYFKAETATIGDIRGIVVGTLPPPSTSLLLPTHDASEQALVCWSTSSDGTSVAQYWVTSNGESQMLCVGTLPRTAVPADVGIGTVLCP
jgi:hypothetical protein